jgi:hypothetical protein
MLLAAFDPPGNLAELSPAARAQWSQFVSARFDEAVAGQPQFVRNDSPRAQYYNAVKTETADDAQTKAISWTAFPRQIQITSISDVQRWQRADAARAAQDEYCEWSMERNGAGKITRVTFTCESPFFGRLVAATDPAKTVALYQEFVSPAVRQEHLYDAQGQYIEDNLWNSSTTQGAMHLVQPNNTLSAEIEIAAAATITRVIDGTPLTGERELIQCGLYGAPERNSDPHIGGEVNALARAKADITLANPVGVYFDSLSTADWETPDGTNPDAFWRYIRGTTDYPMRAVFEIPPERGYTVSDITIAGRAIEFGAQIADFVTVKLTGLACRIGQSTVSPMTACTEFIAAAALAPTDVVGASSYRRSHR